MFLFDIDTKAIQFSWEQIAESLAPSLRVYFSHMQDNDYAIVTKS